MSLDDAQAVSEPRSVDLLALDEALAKLAEFDPRKARAMELKFFGGLQMAEIATVLNISVKTVEKDVRLGAAWLRSALTASPSL
jgi:DNA-directed RNA polymerase specialized sigma24 family protein